MAATTCSTCAGIHTARDAGTRYVLCAAVMRATPEIDNATCAHGWLCGVISESDGSRRAFARTGRAGVGTKRLGCSSGSKARGAAARGMFSIQVDGPS